MPLGTFKGIKACSLGRRTSLMVCKPWNANFKRLRIQRAWGMGDMSQGCSSQGFKLTHCEAYREGVKVLQRSGAVQFQASGGLSAGGLRAEADRIWGICGSYSNIPKVIFYLLKEGLRLRVCYVDAVWVRWRASGRRDALLPGSNVSK